MLYRPLYDRTQSHSQGFVQASSEVRSSGAMELLPSLPNDIYTPNVLSRLGAEDLIEFGALDYQAIDLQVALESTLTVADGTSEPIENSEHSKRWDQLPHGIQWLVFKIIVNDGNSFASVASCTLHLSHQQIEAFVSKYMDEWAKLRDFERTRPEISARFLVDMAVKHKMPVDQVLILYRPRISLDHLTIADLKGGQVYLRHSGLEKYSAKMGAWKGYPDPNFPKLNIPAQIAQEAVSHRMVQAAIRDGWLTAEQSQSISQALANDNDIDSIELQDEDFVPVEEIFQTFTESDIRAHVGAGSSARDRAPFTISQFRNSVSLPENREQQVQKVVPPEPTRDRVLGVCKAICTVNTNPVTRHVRGAQVQKRPDEALVPEASNCSKSSNEAVPELTLPSPTPLKPRNMVTNPTRNTEIHQGVSAVRPAVLKSPGSVPHRAKNIIHPPTPDTTPEKSPKPEPSQVLRHLLKTRWAKYLKDDKDEVGETEALADMSRPRARDEEGEAAVDPDFLDVDDPLEDDGDDDYIPIKKDQVKKNTPKPVRVHDSPTPRSFTGGQNKINQKRVILKTKAPSKCSIAPSVKKSGVAALSVQSAA